MDRRSTAPNRAPLDRSQLDRSQLDRSQHDRSPLDSDSRSDLFACLFEKLSRPIQPLVTSELDAAIAVVTGAHDDSHHPLKVHRALVAFVVPHRVFDRNPLRPLHQLFHTTLRLVAFVVADLEIPGVRQGATVRMVDASDHFGEPVGIAGKASMVLDDDVETFTGTELG